MSNEIIAVALPIQEVTNAELLAINFEEDDEAEFVQGLLKIQETLEQVILSDNPEEFLLPTQTEEAPIWKMIELVDELKRMRFGDRTLSRMERVVRGETRQIEQLTELEKAENPAYKKCPNCPYHYKGNRGLMNHMSRKICKRVYVGQILHPTEKQKKVDDKFYHIVIKLDGMIARSNLYKEKQRAKEPELTEEKYDEEEKEQEEEEEEIINEEDLCEDCGEEPSTWEGRGGYFCKECFDKRPDTDDETESDEEED